MRQSNKFQVGTSAYLIYAIPNNNEKRKTDARYAVHPDMMMVNRVSKDDFGYHYSLVDGNEDIIDWCYEENVFETFEKAAQEVRKRNKNLMEA